MQSIITLQTPDDDINLTYCPTLFVMGDEADDFDAIELLHLRMNMIRQCFFCY